MAAVERMSTFSQHLTSPRCHLCSCAPEPNTAAPAKAPGKTGKNGPPLIIRVPLGTTVWELSADDPRRSKNEYEAGAEALHGLSPQERRTKMREKRWRHYPEYADDSAQHDDFKHAALTSPRERRKRQTPMHRSVIVVSNP